MSHATPAQDSPDSDLRAPNLIAPHPIENPPTTLGGILRRLGPGLIIAASIVGSGELIGTTKTGADAGYTLLWLILIGCVVKVFVQIEFGRFTITAGRGTLDAMNQAPGPRLRVSWLVWYWLLMFLAMMGQLGGIAGGVGQTMAMVFPLTGDFRAGVEAGHSIAAQYTWDDVTWSGLLAVVTSGLLIAGRYRLVQSVSTFLVASFTLVTMFNLFALPWFGDVDLGWNRILDGLKFQLPLAQEGVRSSLATALATFGIIGVGASEVITYPYWCLEKGYARFTGPRDESDGWARRARGWMHVMRWDAWCSMVIYTFATIAFYVLGAAVLHPRGLSPSGNQLVATLAEMYKDVFGDWGFWVFFIGAFAVLYSTFFVASAGNARAGADTLRVFGLVRDTDQARRRAVRALCGFLPLFCFSLYALAKDPVTMVLISGMMQAIMLPLLGYLSLYFLYRRGDDRVRPGSLWRVCLWLSVLLMTVTGIWAALANVPVLAADIRAWFG